MSGLVPNFRAISKSGIERGKSRSYIYTLHLLGTKDGLALLQSRNMVETAINIRT